MLGDEAPARGSRLEAGSPFVTPFGALRESGPLSPTPRRPLAYAPWGFVQVKAAGLGTPSALLATHSTLAAGGKGTMAGAGSY